MKQTSPSSSKHLQQNKWCRQSGRPRYACGEMPTGTHADKTRNLPENHSKLDTKAAANSAEWPAANSLNLQKNMVYENGLSVTTRNGLETSRDPSDHEESSSGEVDECRLQGWENEGAASLGGFPKSGTCLTARHTNGNIDSGDQSNNPNSFAGPSTNGDRIMGDTSLWDSHRTSDQPGHGLSSSQLFTAARDLLATQYLTFNNTHNHINNNLGNAMMRQAGYPYNGMSQDSQFPGTAMLAEMSNANNVNNNVSCWSELSHLKPGLQSILEGVRTLYAASETNSGCAVGQASDAQSDNNSDTPAADYVKKKLAETSVRSGTSLSDSSKPKQSMHNGATSPSSDNCHEETSASNTNAGKHEVDVKAIGKESTSTVKLNCFQVKNSGANDCHTSDTKTLQPKKATECQPILNFHSSTPTGSDNERLLNPSQSMENCVYSQSRSSVNSHSPDASSDKKPRRGDESSQTLNPCTKSSSSETLKSSQGHSYSNGPLANNPCEHQVISSERQAASCDVSIPCDSPATPCDSPASPCDASLPSVTPCNSSPSCDRPTTPMPSTSSFSPDSSTLVSGSSQSSSAPSINNHSDYVGYALKQWTVYLGNVLLNFIHKECRGQQHSTCAAAAQSSSNSSPGFCPCCHYHNQMASSAGSPQQSSSQGFLPNTLHQGYYNYAASFSPFLHQHVQGKDPSVDFTQDLVEESEDERGFDEMSDSVPPIELPAAELSRLEEISELVSSCLPSPIRREKLAVAIENDTYIKKLLNIFHICEDLENSEGLHHLYEIFKNIFLLNKNALFEMMFAEDTIFDVVGCLEYEPGVARPKGHRQYLKSMARFHQVIPITNTELLSKIHQTYRVQYIQDVVLPTPSVFEENMLSTLSSFIFFNKVEIVSLIQEDEKFLTDLFNQLREPKTPEDRRKELVLFLKEFCQFSQTLQPQSRESFYKTLSSLGVLPALEMTLQSAVKETKAASVDILLFIVDFSPSLVREYMMHQINNTDDDGLLMNIVIEGMICDTDPDMGAAVQLMGIIRTLLDPENMLASVNKSEKTDFLNHFYKHCMHVFIAPLLSNTVADAPEKSDSCTVQLLGLILELLSFCVEHHTYHIKNYILHKDLLRRILVLIKSRHTFLKLCAVRFMRKIIALKDEFYNRYIIKGNLFSPVIDALISNNGRYNLLDSAILEMFEFIKIEDIKSLCTHVVENFSTTLEGVTYVQTFKALKLRYDQHQDRLRDRPQIEPVGSILRGGPNASRFRRDPRQMDEDEELWFNDEEDFDEEGVAVGPVATPPDIIAVAHDATNGVSVSPTQSGTHSPTKSDIPSIGRIMEEDKKRELGGPAATRSVSPGSTAAPPTSPNQPAKKVGGLVDYEADSDEEEESSDEDLPPSKRLKTAT